MRWLEYSEKNNWKIGNKNLFKIDNDEEIKVCGFVIIPTDITRNFKGEVEEFKIELKIKGESQKTSVYEKNFLNVSYLSVPLNIRISTVE